MTDPTAPKPTPPPPPVIRSCAACGCLAPAAPKRHCASPTCTWWVCPNKACDRRQNDTHGHAVVWRV